MKEVRRERGWVDDDRKTDSMGKYKRKDEWEGKRERSGDFLCCWEEVEVEVEVEVVYVGVEWYAVLVYLIIFITF